MKEFIQTQQKNFHGFGYIYQMFNKKNQAASNRKGDEKLREDLKGLLAAPEIAYYANLLKVQLEHLKKILRLWGHSKNGYEVGSNSDLLKQYAIAVNQYYEEDQFNPRFTLLQNSQVNFLSQQSEKIIFKSFKLFPKAIWPIRFHNKFTSRLYTLSNDEVLYTMAQVYRLASGVFHQSNQIGGVRPIDAKTIPLNRFLLLKLMPQKYMLIHVGVEKIPIVKNGVIRRFEFIQYMHFLNIISDTIERDYESLHEKVNYFSNQIVNDVAKKDHSQMEIDLDVFNKNQQKRTYLFVQSFDQYSQRYDYTDAALPQKEGQPVFPVPLKAYYVSSTEQTSLVFDQNLKRWVSKDYLNVLQRKRLILYRKQISDEMVKRFVDFQSAKALVDLLTKIPNFKINLTDQEKDVIGENGNVLAIGRSGTGKTTCAVLRLFSIQMLFKIRTSLYKKKYESTIKDVRCGSDDLDAAAGLHCIFLTASPVLTHEIQRYYKKLTDNIKTELDKKKRRVEEEERKRQEEEKARQEREKVEAGQESFEDLNDSEEVKEPQPKQQDNIQILSAPTLEQKKSVEDLEEEHEMCQQFQGIKLKEDLINEQFKEQDEDIDQLKNKFQQSINKFHSLFDLKQSDYPGFFTVRSFIMMVDGALSRPFFIRQKDATVGEDSKASWHNERKGVMMIENYYRSQEKEESQETEVNIQQEFNYSDEEQLEHEYLRQIQLRQNKEKQQLTKKLHKNKKNNVFSFEVDYQYFAVYFWPKIIKRHYKNRKFTPHLVWTQIYSTIKGSAQAHQYNARVLPKKIYINTQSNSFLTKKEKLEIYDVFTQYEDWKVKIGGYDIMDAVNYILNSFKLWGYQGPEIQYVMIDEVQDLPHAIVYLLSKTATYGVFYSGDTAQTIAKGVGFRFGDLNALFDTLTIKKPVLKHLTVNFRSHNNILQLANSVVSSLEIIFPNTIDRLKKQVSDLKGPKPMILSSSDQQLLFYVLCGGEEHNAGGQDNLKKPPLEFGCDQVIIVRDQQSKLKVPAMLQHALCLTIYEAKGLEFNDVILFNFFQQSPCPEKWRLLNSLHVNSVEIEKQEYEKNFSRHAQKNQMQNENEKGQNSNEEVQVQQHFNKQKNVYEVKKIINKDIKKDINDFAELCSDLKLLYTAITRPKKTLIIYDAGYAAARAPLQRLWEQLNVIQIITKELVLDSANTKSMSEETKIFEKIVTSTDKSQWRQQGLKMYARGYFDQAMKCFDKSGSTDLYMKAEANKYADEATKTLIQMQSERNMIKQRGHRIEEMTSHELNKLKNKIKLEENEALRKFEKAGIIFEKLLMFKQAGQCFFSGKQFEKAFESFNKISMYKQAAQSLQMLKRYKEAAQYYGKDQNYLKTIECLDMLNQWYLILQTIQKFAQNMTEFERQALLKKYSALALQQLVYQIQFQNEEESNKPQNNRVEIIEEKESDEEDQWDSQEAPEHKVERERKNQIDQDINPQQQIKQQQTSEYQKGLISIKESVYEQLGTKEEVKQSQKAEDNSISFSALNSSKPAVQQMQENKNEELQNVDESFGDLNNSDAPIVLEGIKSEQKADLESIQSSFSDLNTKYENQLLPDLQSIKSMVDPDDIWVKNSISEITHKLHSQYSVLDDQEENYNINVKIIKTKGNIYIQDQIMRKIVNIVSIINSSVHDFFKQFKGYQSLITVSGDKAVEVIDNRPEISQFQDIDPKFINIILDTLESFKLFKLCLFVCNRYHLPGKAGRYLISLGMKYSTNCISNNIVNPILLAPSLYRKNELEKGILASIAIHAIYQNVNAQFLKIKVTENDDNNKNTLGSYFIQGLILQGLYKKAVFMVNPQQSLKILANYNDFEAYNTIFRQKMPKEDNLGTLAFFESTKNTAEVNYTIMLLKRAYFEYCVCNKFSTVSQRYYKEFQNQQKIDIKNRISQFSIPSYLPFTKILFENQPEDFILKLKEIISNGYQILTNGPQLLNLDFVCTLLAVVHNEQMQQMLVYNFDNDSFLQFYRCANYIKTVLRKKAGRNALVILESVLSMHQCYKINYCKSMTFINDTFCFVHRTSTVANELVSDQKTSTANFAYFFEQDYNYILTKTAKVVQIISKKYEQFLPKLYNKRINHSIYLTVYLHQDWVASEEENIIKKALSFSHQTKSNKKRDEETIRKKPKKNLKKGYDFRCRGQDHVIVLDDFSDSEEEEQVDKELRFYRYNTNKRMTYLATPMLHQFQKLSHSKEKVEGSLLYGCNLSSSYREYIQKRGGFNLYDAMEFQRFKRLDLFAQNILSVFNNLTLYTRQCLLGEILVLLLLQYKSLQQPKGFSVRLTTDLLKYLEKLQFCPTLSQKNANSEKLSIEEVNSLLANNVECRFNYVSKYVSQMSSDDLAGMICDYLQLLQEEEASAYVDFSKIILCYAINIGKNGDINQCLRKLINQLGPVWKNQSLSYLMDNKSLGDYENKRKRLFSTLKQIDQVLHEVIVDNQGNLKRAIAESEFDYEVEGRILKAKAKAVSKIANWWKIKRVQLRNSGTGSNYFEFAVATSNISSTIKPTLIGDIRLIRMIHKLKKLGDIDLLIKTEIAKTELLSFYLTTTISSSLDFHFILMSLNKIEQCRRHYFQQSQDIDELHQFQIDQIHEEMNEMLGTIQAWKNDEKWLRDKNVSLKKKKVFEVKWLTRNISIDSLLKKRAGLKKQAILQDKRKDIKHNK